MSSMEFRALVALELVVSFIFIGGEVVIGIKDPFERVKHCDVHLVLQL